ncbi:MAG: hypothetical protein AB1679_17460 [Actinomycetota bacterium]|jgi:hypothetical protein
MRTPTKKSNGSWYDTPLGRLYGGEARRRAQPTVAEAVAELTRRHG